MTSFRWRGAVVGAGLLMVPVLAQAQLVRSTGVDVTAGRDNRWSISADGGAFAAAFLVTSPPSVWQTNVPGSYAWVSGSASGSLSGTSYRLRTQFTLGSGDALSLTLRCAVDNSLFGIFINGTQVGTNNSCGPANNFQFGPSQTFTSWVTGLNTLEFRWSGDNTTDGLLVSIDNVTLTPPGNPGIVPEPSTYLLLGSGLLALAAVRRRRRS